MRKENSDVTLSDSREEYYADEGDSNMTDGRDSIDTEPETDDEGGTDNSVGVEDSGDMSILSSLAEESSGGNGLVDVREKPAEEGEIVEPQESLPISIARRFPYEGLYKHQSEAIGELANGNDVCVSTDTASGKTLVYALYFAMRYTQTDGDATGLFIYPTKSLSRDQETELSSLYEEMGLDISVGVYDGDVEKDVKRRLRTESDIIITNIQGMNYYLPHHEKWESFYTSLEVCVVDEAHTYSGVQGSHSAWVLRRIRRVVSAEHGQDPQFISSTATIGNPAEHTERLTGREPIVIDTDTSPSGGKEIGFWNSYTSDSGFGDFENAHREGAAEILARTVAAGRQSLLFVDSRRQTERLATKAKEFADEELGESIGIRPYHAGINKVDRQSTEDRLKRGDIGGVVSTSALEVGIDIGSMDCVILDGYPGTKASFWQRIGRAGRGTETSLAVLVAGGTGIDQYMLNNPEYLVSGDVEDVVVDLANQEILKLHLRAAANEHPLTSHDSDYFTNEFSSVVDTLKSEGELSGTLSGGVEYVGDEFRPESQIDLYTASEPQFQVNVEDNSVKIPDIGLSRAYREYHPHAIVQRDGVDYVVSEFKQTPQTKEVTLERVDVDFHTQSQQEVEITNMNPVSTVSLSDDVRLSYGTATIKQAFREFSRHHHNRRDDEYGIPTGIQEPLTIPTKTIWITFEEGWLRDILNTSEILGSMHAAEHALIKMSPIEISVDKQDLGGLSISRHPETGKPTIVIYEGIPGGAGFTRSLYNTLPSLVQKTQANLADCQCQSESGCPLCVMDSQCGDNNEPLNRQGAVELLGALLSLL